MIQEATKWLCQEQRWGMRAGYAARLQRNTPGRTLLRTGNGQPRAGR